MKIKINSRYKDAGLDQADLIKMSEGQIILFRKLHLIEKKLDTLLSKTEQEKVRGEE